MINNNKLDNNFCLNFVTRLPSNTCQAKQGRTRMTLNEKILFCLEFNFILKSSFLIQFFVFFRTKFMKKNLKTLSHVCLVHCNLDEFLGRKIFRLSVFFINKYIFIIFIIHIYWVIFKIMCLYWHNVIYYYKNAYVSNTLI